MDTTILFALIACCLIGVVIGAAIGVEIMRDLEAEPEEHTYDSRSCDTCRYEDVKPTEAPCCDCVTDDTDMWEEKI